MDAIERPMVVVGNVIADARNYVSLRADNEKLRADNAQLKDWQNAAAALQRENRELRELLRFKTEPGLAYISARVIADTGGAFARGLIVTAGKLDGVRQGMAAMTGDGLVGRVVEVGDWSSRVVLITDLNSRIPVTIAPGNIQAMMTGDNTPNPVLEMVLHTVTLHAGDQVVSSGDGGLLPPGLPVGTVVQDTSGNWRVQLLADPAGAQDVEILNFAKPPEALPPTAQLPAEAAGLKPAPPPPPATQAAVTPPPAPKPVPKPVVAAAPAAAADEDQER